MIIYLNMNNKFNLYIFHSKNFLFFIFLFLFIFVSGCGNVGVIESGKDGRSGVEIRNGFLVDKANFSLYFYKGDGENKSNCYWECFLEWPPYYANKDSVEYGDFRIIKRLGGRLQWSYKGHPLYYFDGDKKSGSRQGDGVEFNGFKWYLAK